MRRSKVVFALNPLTDSIAKRKQKDSYVTPHKVEGGKRKGKSLKKEPRAISRAHVTVKQAKEALTADPNAMYDKDRKCLVYFRKVGE